MMAERARPAARRYTRKATSSFAFAAQPCLRWLTFLHSKDQQHKYAASGAILAGN
jgi:hypothetical protein